MGVSTTGRGVPKVWDRSDDAKARSPGALDVLVPAVSALGRFGRCSRRTNAHCATRADAELNVSFG